MADKHVHEPSYFFSTNSAEEKRNRYKRGYRHSRYCKHCGTLIIESDDSKKLTKWQLLNCAWAFAALLLCKKEVLARWHLIPCIVLFFVIDYIIFRQKTWVTPSYLKKRRKL